MNSTKKFSVVIPNSIEKLIKKYPFFVQSKFKDTIERFEKG